MQLSVSLQQSTGGGSRMGVGTAADGSLRQEDPDSPRLTRLTRVRIYESQFVDYCHFVIASTFVSPFLPQSNKRWHLHPVNSPGCNSSIQLINSPAYCSQ